MAAEPRTIESKWVGIETSEGLRLKRIDRSLTFGSAISNGVRLPPKVCRPIQGILTLKSDGAEYRDFELGKVQSIRWGERMNIAGFSLIVDEAQGLAVHLKETMTEELKSILTGDFENNFEKAFAHLTKNWDCSEVAWEIRAMLRQYFDELLLSGPLERLLLQDSVSDVLALDWNSIWFEKEGQLKKAQDSFSSDAAYRVYVENLLSSHHCVLDEQNSFADFSMPNNVRVHITSPALSGGTYYLSFRKPTRSLWSLDQLERKGFLHSHQKQTLQKLIHQNSNIIISGATGTGKTTLIKSLLAEIPDHERIICLEDLPELKMNRENTLYLKTRSSWDSGRKVSLSQLLKEALRMRPDRLVLGEARGDEAWDLLQAMNTGHQGSIGSIHGNSARDSLNRLSGLASLRTQNLDESMRMVAHNIHAVIHLTKEEGHRKISEICLVRGLEDKCFVLEKY